jgi:hypothetical protein
VESEQIRRRRPIKTGCGKSGPILNTFECKNTDNRKMRQKHGSDIVFEEIIIDARFGPVFQD